VDGSVRRIETAYDGQGNAYLVTSYDATTSGNIVNQIQRAFNGLGQLITEWQSHSGAVNTSTTPKVQYTYSEMPSGANHSRLTGIVYPNGRTVSYDYGTGSGLNDTISRLDSLKESSTVLEGYRYLGLGTVVVRSHPSPGLDLTYVKRSGESNGDAGDQYIGLDRFGRVVDQRWVVASSGTATDRFQYGYDRDGNRLYRDNLVNTAFGELYSYDGLNQLVSFDRGTLNSGKTAITGTVARSQDWDYDALGNFDSVTTNGGSPATRSANAQNEITSISGATTPTYDANGNMIGDETGKTLVYDAWNRLVTVKSGSTTLTSYQYDGENRRVSENPGAARDLYYSSDWQVLEERVGGNAQVQYVWSPVYVDAMLLRDRDSDANGSLDERLWVQQDANWNETAFVDGSGIVQERYDYDPFGAQVVLDANWAVDSDGVSDVQFRHGFQGLQHDPVSGLDSGRMRWYAPTLGRWLTTDPIRFSGGDSNFYAFVGENPVDAVDPNGTEPIDIPVKAGKFTIDMTPKITTVKLKDKNGKIVEVELAGVEGTITFTPNPQACPECKSIRLIQAANVSLKNGKPYDWPDDPNRNAIRTKLDKPKDVVAGWYIDHNGTGRPKGKTAPIYYNDNYPKKDISKEGFNIVGGGVGPTAMYDAPRTSMSVSGITEMKFETVAVCVDTGTYLGAIRWTVSYSDGAVGLAVIRKGYDTPSPSFLAAVDSFNRFYGIR